MYESVCCQGLAFCCCFPLSRAFLQSRGWHGWPDSLFFRFSFLVGFCLSSLSGSSCF